MLGSRATSLVGGFGGHAGRALAAGDRLAMPAAALRRRAVPNPGRAPELAPSGGAVEPAAVRVLPGPAVAGPQDALFRAFLEAGWLVRPDSDRRGIRLEGPELDPGGPADRPSSGMLPGAIQLPPSRQPIVLMPDGGTTGGYPVVAVVCAADLGRLGQLAPGSIVRFEPIGLEEAREAERARRIALAEAQRRSALS
jgi:allophanate hydrolase subunit 2